MRRADGRGGIYDGIVLFNGRGEAGVEDGEGVEAVAQSAISSAVICTFILSFFDDDAAKVQRICDIPPFSAKKSLFHE